MTVRSFESVVIETLQVDRNGTVVLGELPAGDYTIEFTDVAGVTVVRDVHVLGNELGNPGDLALTGASVLRTVLGALVLIAAGLALSRQRPSKR